MTYQQSKIDEVTVEQQFAEDLGTTQAILKAKGKVPDELKRKWVSTPIPDIDGHTYTVTRHPDGFYDCKDETGSNCIRRTMNGHCHHVRGCILMLENITVKPPKRYSKKWLATIDLINKRRRHKNSQLAWEEIQDDLPERIKFVFGEIMKHPGQTRWQLTQSCVMAWRSLTPIVTMLKDANWIIEGEDVVIGGCMPSATIFPNPDFFLGRQ